MFDFYFFLVMTKLIWMTTLGVFYKYHIDLSWIEFLYICLPTRLCTDHNNMTRDHPIYVFWSHRFHFPSNTRNNVPYTKRTSLHNPNKTIMAPLKCKCFHFRLINPLNLRYHLGFFSHQVSWINIITCQNSTHEKLFGPVIHWLLIRK